MSTEMITPHAAPAPGTAIAGSTTIDALCTTLFATRSSDLGTPTYAWGVTGTSIIGTFTAGTTPSATQCQIIIAFQPKSVWPSYVMQ